MILYTAGEDYDTKSDKQSYDDSDTESDTKRYTNGEQKY